MYHKFMIIGCLSTLLYECIAFGELGHNIIGQHVQKNLGSEATSRIDRCEYLKEFDNDLGKASAWADQIRFRHGWGWTAQYHYLDILDNPPDNCEFAMPDTPIHLLSGLHQFSYMLKRPECDRFAFLMLLHLTEDAHQPLHLTAKDRGGNDRAIYLDHQRMNLHHAWDTFFIEKLDRRHMNNYIEQRMYSSSLAPSMDYLDWIKNISLVNCQIVWRWNSKNYENVAEDKILELLFMAVHHTVQLLEASL